MIFLFFLLYRRIRGDPELFKRKLENKSQGLAARLKHNISSMYDEHDDGIDMSLPLLQRLVKSTFSKGHKVTKKERDDIAARIEEAVS